MGARPAGGSQQVKNERSVKTLAMVVMAALLLSAAGYLLVTRRGGSEGQEVTLPGGLKYVDLAEGTGASPQIGHKISVRYRGTLLNGEEFDSSRGQAVEFEFSSTKLIKGWIEGLMNMKVGGKRRLTIPSALGYGPAGSPPKIPPNATLVFEVELLSVK
jgi:peptidylprolyl isomerase